MELDLTVDIRELERTTRGINLRGRNLAPVFRQLKPLLKADVDENFRTRQGPQSKWPKLATATIERKQYKRNRASTRRGRNPRRVSSRSTLGKIRKAYSVDIGRQHLLAVWDKIEWAAVHQEGGRAGPGGQSDIPQRVFGYVSEIFIRRATERMARYVARGF